MDAEFAPHGLVPAERIGALMTRVPGRGARRLLAQAVLYFATAIALVLVDDPVAVALLVLASGVVQFGMFGMLHESCHKTALATPRGNLVAGWIAALAQPMSPALMRAFHFEHHRHTHELDADPELAGMPFMVDWPRGVMWPLTFTGLPVLFARAMWAVFAALVPAGPAWDRVLPFVAPERRSRVAWEARALLAIHGTAIATAALLLPQLWRVHVAMLLGHMLMSWYITAEHRGLPDHGTVLDRTRSVAVPGIVLWLLWNMPYHAEHHAWPAVPWYALPDLHREMCDHIVHREGLLAIHHRRGRPQLTSGE